MGAVLEGLVEEPLENVLLGDLRGVVSDAEFPELGDEVRGPGEEGFKGIEHERVYGLLLK